MFKCSIDQRICPDGWSQEALAVRQVLKLVMELGELAEGMHDTGTASMALGFLIEAAEVARMAFDDERTGDVSIDWRVVQKKLADVLEPLAVLAMLAGVDLEAAA